MNQTPAIFRYWGKADSSYDGEPKWHPLAYHSLDVAACGQTLLRQQPAWLESLARLSGLEPAVLSPWLVFLLAIHDMGKFGDGFQSLRPNLQQELQGRAAKVAYDVLHDTLGYAVVMEHLPEWLGFPDLARRGGSLLRLWAAAVTGHHGRPPMNDGLKAHVIRHLPANTVMKDAEQFVVDARRLLLPESWTFPGRAGDSLERYKRTSWLFAGVAVAADWLGSNTRWFKYHQPSLNLEEYWHQLALPRAETAVSESGMCAPISASDAAFARLFPRIAASPTPLQAWADAVVIGRGPQLFVLEELTGGGKTEAALTLAARLMKEGCARGVYFALPTMATADAMFDRVQKKFDVESDEPWRRFFSGGNAALVLAHSAAGTKQKLDALQLRDGGYNDQHEEASASQYSTAWIADSRKKALLADFGVGTVDQALLAVMPLRHQSLRLLGVSTKVLVVDEVHACDCYMGELLARLLRFHAALGGSAVLLSATLPQEHREKLISAFADGAEFANRAPVQNDYPLATHLHASGIAEVHTPAREAVSRKVAVEPFTDEDAVFQRLQATVSRGGCAVWVRNTVADAVAAWHTWSTNNPDDPATLFHARFALCDRLKIGEQINKDFGAESRAEARRRRLVIATQVVEQSLDVDFDDMVTDLAPIDLVIQRAGRLQRHKRDVDGNPAARDGRSGAKLGVLMPEPTEDAGSDWFKRLLPKAARVYPDHGKLWLTGRWLASRGTFDLSADARDMIESVYAEDGYERIPPALQGVTDAAEGACKADKGTARSNLLSFDQGYDPTGMDWPDEDAQVDITTRLGEKTVRLRLAKISGGNLTSWAVADENIEWTLSELTVPRRLLTKESYRYAGLIKQAREKMPDQGRYCLIVPFEQYEDAWRGWALRERDEDVFEEVRVMYSPKTGLSIESGEVIDESDL
ncbi:MAG: CRISPR-associated helicase Cas3' [Pseudomonadota bacterium]|nr:CRISPR-associated helicase Cas3' [Pseudomonadota bacterium]